MTSNIDDDPNWVNYRIRPRAKNTDGASINTASGGYVNLMVPHPDDILILDIAAGLSRQCRFGGQLPQDKFYSVAQHCVHVTRALREEGHGWETQLKGLLHDAAEAYMGDMQTPLKRIVPAYKDIERGLQRVIYASFGLSLDENDSVKLMDARVFLVEKVIVLGNTDHWPNAPKVEPANIAFTVWDWRVAREAFMNEFQLICEGMK